MHAWRSRATRSSWIRAGRRWTASIEQNRRGGSAAPEKTQKAGLERLAQGVHGDSRARPQREAEVVEAIDAVRAGVAGCLCSDYQPSTLIAAAFVVAAQTDLTLPQAVALVSANPAAACNLTDRGRLAQGLRADMVAVTLLENLPMVTHTWSAGRLVFSSHYRAAATQRQRELVPA